MKLNLMMVIVIVMSYMNKVPTMLSYHMHLVGGKAWDVPSEPNHYETWAKGVKFVIDDILVFDFLTGNHTVAEVPKAVYDTCNTTAVENVTTLGPTTVTLSLVGIQFFICTMHCKNGQKVAVDVKES